MEQQGQVKKRWEHWIGLQRGGEQKHSGFWRDAQRQCLMAALHNKHSEPYEKLHTLQTQLKFLHFQGHGNIHIAGSVTLKAAEAQMLLIRLPQMAYKTLS